MVVEAKTEVEEYVGPLCHEPGFRGRGHPEGGVVLIGIAPGRDEVKTGRPFTGPSGRLLNGMLSAAGWSRDKVYCTNLICWWKDDPSPEEAHRCSPRLFAELEALKPRLIILLGKIVVENFLGIKFSKARGAVLWNDKLNCYIMSTNHPAAVLHGRSETGANKRTGSNVAFDLYRDFCKIPTILSWGPGAPLAQVEYRVVESTEEAQSVLDNLPRDGTPISLDVETASKDIDEIDVFVDKLLCLAISDGKMTWVFPEQYARGLTWPTDDVWWTFHNALFDVQVVRRHLGVWLNVREDTMLMSYSVDERQGYHGLKPLAREYLGAGFWEEERKKSKSFDAIPKPVLYKYNAHDAAYTARLVQIFRPRQEAEGTRSVYENIMLKAVNTFKEIQFHGVRINKDLLNQFAVEWGKWYLQLEDDLVKMAYDCGWPKEKGDLNVQSHVQLSKFIYDILSLPPNPGGKGQTGKGSTNPRSTDQDNLARLAGLHPFIDKLNEFRHVSHQYDVYIVGMLNQLKADGKAHAVVRLHGTVTGRIAYTNPPLQTIPRPYKFEDTFGRLRELFIPSDDDMVIIEADYGKAEIWMAYHYSRDPQLLADLLSGDYHTTVACDVMGKERHEVNKKDRRDMKLVTFGVMYGREEASLAAGIERSRAEARAYIDGFFRRNAQYANYARQTERDAIEAGELVSTFGRKRRFIFIGQSWDARALKQAINFPIQSTTSDCTLSSVIELHPLLEAIGAHILISVHDSIILEAPRARLTEALTLLHNVMTKQRYPGIVQLPIEIKVGKSWGHAKEVHNCEENKCGDQACMDQGNCLDHVWKGADAPTYWHLEKAML